MPVKSTNHKLWRIVLVAALVVIGILSLMSAPPKPPEIFSWDKLQHTATYMALTMLFYNACLFRDRSTPNILLCAVLAWLYGALIETFQFVLPFGRTADFGDLAANLLGVLLGSLLLYLCHHTGLMVSHES